MKTITKIILGFGFLTFICTTSADNNTTSSNGVVTKPGGQTTVTSTSDVPSTKDIEKVGDPSFAASALATPMRWIMDIFYYIWHYLIYDPIAISADLAVKPITLSFDAVTLPISFLLGPIMKPFENMIGNQYNMTKDLVWWTALETISYGSGLTAETISEAMQLAMNGVVQFLTDIGLPIANTAEKISQLSDQMANTRSKRSLTDATNSLGSGIYNIIRFPFYLLEAIFSMISYPLRMMSGMVMLPFSFLFGIGSAENEDSTHTLMLTDLSTRKITSLVLDEMMLFLKNILIPELDKLANELKDSKTLPEGFREILTNFDVLYNLIKAFGYVK